MGRQRARSLVTLTLILALTGALGSATWPVHSQGAPEGTADAALIESIRRVSVASDGTQANQYSDAGSVSADGRYVAFASGASNLVSGDTNGREDVFVHDVVTGTTMRVSVATDGTQGNNHSYGASLSADGRYVAFYSSASNLIGGDTNGRPDVFVHDQATSTTTRVSVATDGIQGNSDSYVPSLSADGRYVAFWSAASNLVSGDTNGREDVFVHDVVTGTTTRVSVATDGTQGNSSSYAPSLSADGRYVAFDSDASNLVSGDTNDTGDVFVHDRMTGTTTRVSVAADGTQGNSSSYAPSLSADGRYVAFQSFASNLVSGDTNGVDDVFVHDQATGTTTRVSVATDGTQGNNPSYGASSLSADGRYVAFHSFATNLVSGDTNGTWDVFVHDRTTGITARISVTTDGTQGNDDSYAPSLSADGRYVAFHSSASNLVSGDTNGVEDVFIAPTGFAVPDAARSEVTATPLSVLADGTTSITASVTLRDAFNVPLAGVPVMLSSAPNTVSITPASATTNASGVATFSVTSTSAGGKTLSAVAGGVTLTQTAEVTFTQLPQPDTVGVFRPSNSRFYLRYQNTTGPADITLVFGTADDLPVAGDWNGDGVDTIGVYRTSTGVFFLKDANTSAAPVVYQLTLGNPGDLPMAGDWDGDGKDGVGTFRPTNGRLYLKNALTTGLADFAMVLGINGDRPVAGDWNGDGFDSPGVYRPSNSRFFLTDQRCNCIVFADYQLTFGAVGDVGFAGDWDGNGRDGVGVFRPTNGRTYLRNTLTTGFADVSLIYGIANDRPIAGKWQAPSTAPSDAAPEFKPGR